MAEIINKEVKDNIGYMTQTAYNVMNYYMQGLNISQIATRLDLKYSYVSALINAPNFQHQLSIRRATLAEEIDRSTVDAQKEATDVLRRHAKEAAEKMALLLDSENEAMIFKSSESILDRVGPPKNQKSQSASVAVIVEIGSDDAKLISETMEML